MTKHDVTWIDFACDVCGEDGVSVQLPKHWGSFDSQQHREKAIAGLMAGQCFGFVKLSNHQELLCCAHCAATLQVLVSPPKAEGGGA